MQSRRAGVHLYTGALRAPALAVGFAHRRAFRRGVVAAGALAVCLLVPASAFAAVEPPVTEPATSVTGNTAVLHGVLNPSQKGEPGRWRFYYRVSGEEPASCRGAGEVEDPSEPPGSALGEQAEAVSVTLGGLLPSTTYSFCVWTRNEAGEAAEGAPVTFTTPASAPVISEEATVGVNATSATVAASVNAEGLSTEYRVEYGTSSAYGSSTPEVGAADAPEPVPVQASLSGLLPGTVYHYRFVAGNSVGVGDGVDGTFTTSPVSGGGGGASGCSNSAFSGFSAALPDCRAFESVSGAENPGEVYVPTLPGAGLASLQDVVTDLPLQASTDGEGVAYQGDPGAVGGTGHLGRGLGNQFLAVRDAGDRRWNVSDISPPPVSKLGLNEIPGYQGFSSDLSLGVLFSSEAGFAAAARPAGPEPCSVLYSRTGTAGGSAFHALFSETQTPGSCGNAAEEELLRSSERAQLLQFAGGNSGSAGVAEDSQLLFQSPAALTKEAKPSPAGAGANLYDSSAAGVALVNMVGGVVDTSAVFGGPPEQAEHGSAADFSNVISADGSRVFWTALEAPVEEGRTVLEQRPVALYAREDPASPSASTVQLDAAQAEAQGTSGGGRFWTASSDGSKVLFTDCSRLTKGSTAVSTAGCEHELNLTASGREREAALLTGNDLYQYDFAKPAGSRLTDLTVAAAGEEANVQGVVDASSDGSYVYFVAGGALAPGAEKRKCREAKSEKHERENVKAEKGEPELLPPQERELLEAEQSGEEHGHLPAGRGCNLYVWHAGEGTRFIAALAAKDDNTARTKSSSSVRTGVWQPELGARTGQATGSGGALVFESTQQLTGYQNAALDSPRPEHGLEVFVYDFASGRLACASCSPAGSPPVTADGGAYLQVAANPVHRPRWINEEGSEVFFDSGQPLVSQDTNGAQDVYQWEREGSASCPVATSSSGGCVFLLSGADNSDSSYFIESDATGHNVFLVHRGQLGQVGAPGKMNLFDVRVGGGFPETSLACTGTGCQGAAPAPPSFATPASLTFAAPGNLTPPTPVPAKPKAPTRAQLLAKALKACHTKHNRHRRLACEKQARKRYSAKSSKGRR
jgi:hypothetical protein